MDAAVNFLRLSAIILAVYGASAFDGSSVALGNEANPEATVTKFCPETGFTSTDPDLYSCLVISTDKRNWHDALAVCEEHGGTLVKIENQKQQDYIKSKQRNNKYTWFGMNDLEVEGKFVWTDRQPVTWFNWEASSRQPNGGARQNCTSINDKYIWEDKECENLYYYVCQIIAISRPVENVFSLTSPAILDKKATLKKPDQPNDIQLMTLLNVVDQSVCVLYCLYNPDCISLAYGLGKSPYNCLLYKKLAGGFAPLWNGWNTYTLIG